MKQRKKRYKTVRNTTGKRAFSLLELILSLSILTLIAGVLSYQLGSLLQAHRLREGLKSLVVDVRTMQSLALFHQADFELAFAFDPRSEKWSYTFQTDEPLPYRFDKTNISLPGVSKVEVDRGSGAPLHFTLTSRGCFSEHLTLRFEGQRKRFLLDLNEFKLNELLRSDAINKP